MMVIQRRLTLFVLGIICATAAAMGQAPQWKSVAPPGFDQSTTGFSFPTADTGFAVSWSFTPGEQLSTLLATTNRGESWSSRTMEGVQLHDISFTTPRRGVVVGHNYECDCGVLLTTTNGGANWTPKTYPGNKSLNGIHFINASNGFISGSKGMLLRTTDGGSNWTSVNVPIASGMNLLGIDFPTPSTGYIIAFDTTRAETNVLLKSTDGGVSWKKEFDGGSVAGSGPVFFDLDFITADVGLFAGRQGTQAMYRTADGGKTVTRVFTPTGTSMPGAMSVVEFANDTLGYAAGSEGLVLRTTDAGMTWKGENTGTSQPLGAIAVLDERTVMVGGILGVLRKRTAEFKPRAVFSTDRLEFGTVTGPTERTLTVSAANEAGLRIEALTIDNKDLGFTVISPATAPPYELAPGASLEVVIRFTPDQSLPDEPLTDLMITTNDNEEPIARVTLMAQQSTEALPMAVLSADSVAFGEVPANRTMDRSFTIDAANTAGLTITKLQIDEEGTSPAFSLVAPSGFPVNVQQGQPVTVTVRFTPHAGTTLYSGTLVVRTNDAGEPERHLSLSGRAGAPVASANGAATGAARLEVQARPNPLTGDGTIIVTIPQATHTSAILFNMLGERIATLYEGHAEAGELHLPMDAGALAPGFYYCIVETEHERCYREIAVVR